MLVVSTDFTDEVSVEVPDGLLSNSVLSVVFSGIVWYVVCTGNTGDIDGQLKGKLRGTYGQIQGVRVSNLELALAWKNAGSSRELLTLYAYRLGAVPL